MYPSDSARIIASLAREVFSPTTQGHDRSAKFASCRRLPSSARVRIANRYLLNATMPTITSTAPSALIGFVCSANRKADTNITAAMLAPAKAG